MKRIFSMLTLLAMLLSTIIISGGPNGFIYLVDPASVFILIVLTVSMLIFSDLWKDYIRGFKLLFNKIECTTKELRVTISAMQLAIKFMFYAATIIMIIGSIMMLRYIEDPMNIAPSFSVNILVLLYAIVINFFHHGIIGKLKKELVYREDH